LTRPSRRHFRWVPVLTTAAVGGGVGAIHFGFIPDDLYIYLTMTRNVLAGDGWGFAPGEAVNVASSPAWFAWLLFLGKCFGVETLAPRLSSGLFTMVGIGLAAGFAQRLAGRSAAGWLAGSLLAFDVWIGRWCWSGMETGATVALVVAFVWLRYEARPGRGADRIASLLLGVGPLLRPELVLLAVVSLSVDTLRFVIERDRARLARLAWDLGSLVLVGGIWLAVSASIWGSPIPATMVAKGSLGASHLSAWRAGLRVLAVIGSSQGAIAILAVLLGLGFLRKGTRRSDVAAIILGMTALLVLVYALRHVTVYTRYALPVSILLTVLGAAALLDSRAASRLRGVCACLVLSVSAAWNLGFGAQVVWPGTKAYARSMNEMVLPLVDELREKSKPGDVIAVPNIGAFGFFSKRRILDLNGLATPDLVSYKREGRLREYLEQHPPDWLVEIEPSPRRWEADPGRLILRRIGVHRFDGMFVTRKEPMYYTVYRVEGLRRP